MKRSGVHPIWFTVVNADRVRLFVHTATGRATPVIPAEPLPRPTRILLQRNGETISTATLGLYRLLVTDPVPGIPPETKAFFGYAPLVHWDRRFRNATCCAELRANAHDLLGGDRILIVMDLSARRFSALLKTFTSLDVKAAVRAVKRRRTAMRSMSRLRY